MQMHKFFKKIYAFEKKFMQMHKFLLIWITLLIPNTDINPNKEKNQQSIKIKEYQNSRPYTTVIGGQGLSGINVEGDVRMHHGGVSYYKK